MYICVVCMYVCVLCVTPSGSLSQLTLSKHIHSLRLNLTANAALVSPCVYMCRWAEEKRGDGISEDCVGH